MAQAELAMTVNVRVFRSGIWLLWRLTSLGIVSLARRVPVCALRLEGRSWNWHNLRSLEARARE